MSVLVTGGAGYVGSHVVLRLVEAGENVIVLDNLSTGARRMELEGVKFFQGDIGDKGLIKRLAEVHEIDCVMHLAGSLVVSESVLRPLPYYWNNTAKSIALIEAVVDAKIPNFVLSSTSAVYGNPESSPVSERARPQPESPYGSSKAMVERILSDVSAVHPLCFTALRYFNASGADSRGRAGDETLNSTHLIKVACEASFGYRAGMSVNGTDYPTADGTCVRDYVHVSDLAEAHCIALDRMRNGGQSLVLNLGSGKGHSVLDVIAQVIKTGGREFEVKLDARRPGDPAVIVADISRAEEVLRWFPKRSSLENIIADTLAWESRLAADSGQGNQKRAAR